MTDIPLTAADLGWSAHFLSHVDLDELSTSHPVRVSAVHRDSVAGLAEGGPQRLALPPGLSAGEVAVGDWALARDGRLLRLLPRRSLLKRRAAGTGRAEQLIAANVDTLFIVTSCNADFNERRLERYLVLAADAEIAPVLVLTKADLAGDADSFRRRAERLSPGTPVELLDARDTGAALRLCDWLGRGRTGAVVGSSGVGKSTLLNSLTGRTVDTAPIREDDAKGRHTTTARGLFPAPGGAWIIDTPGMRALRLTDVADGIDAVFSDIGALAAGCRFADCAHETEPGCAVQAAIAVGTLDPDRLRRWRKLEREDARNSASIAETRQAERRMQKLFNSGKERRRRKEDF